MKSTKKILAIILSATLLTSVISINASGLSSDANKDWEAAVPYSMGDLNGDSKVTAADARLTLRAAVNIDTLTEEQTTAADVLCNGKIEVKDARKILRSAVDIESFWSVPALSAADEKRIRQDGFKAIFGVNADSVEGFPIGRYYGSYNGSVVIMFDYPALALYAPIVETIEGITISHALYHRILVWNDGNILTLTKAYEQSLLTLENIKTIAGIQNNKELDYMLEWFGFNDNIIIGKPVEITYGNKDAGVVQNDCHIILIEYKFQITDSLAGNELPEYITVRSQLGNIFEIGKEYCISPFHLNNTLWDTHTIHSFSQYMQADLITKEEVDNLRAAATEKAKEFTKQKPVVEKASLTSDFISSVDLAVEITVIEKYKEKLSNSIFDVEYKINNILHGKEYESLLFDLLRINSDVEVGETYMILLSVINDSFVLPAARNGAVIKKDSSSYSEYANALINYMGDYLL